MRVRFQRNKRREIADWPDGVPSPSEVAARVRYVGSPEHKSHPSEGGPGRLRSDATQCAPALTQDLAGNTDALRRGILGQCVSAGFDGDFPRYVWTWLGEDLYEARHIHGPEGTYKGYKLESIEYPKDRDGRLARSKP